ncbi:MAG TPA: cytidylate kinase-like family protein [Bacillota bacterium]|nr:cytidylate kinase-like family protein [Bacillota bacterium]
MSNRIITVSRQYGSGGAEIAKKLSEMLGIEYFDKDRLKAYAEKNGLSKDVFDKIDRQATNSFLYSLAVSSYSGHTPSGVNDVILSDRLYLMQSEEIKRIAQSQDCIIVGRAADDILSKFEGTTSVFINADYDFRLKRVMEQCELTEANARTLIKKTDKKRASYYNFYSNKVWGEAENYHLCFNSSILGIDDSALFLKSYIDLRYKH